MRTIIIESTCYKLTEKQFKDLWIEHEKLFAKGYHSDNGIRLSDYFEANKHKYRLVGDIEYDFRL